MNGLITLSKNNYISYNEIIYVVTYILEMTIIFTILFIRNANNVLIYLLNFAAGAMMYVTVFELIPKIKNDKNIFEGIAWIFIGFFIMMLGNIIIK